MSDVEFNLSCHASRTCADASTELKDCTKSNSSTCFLGNVSNLGWMRACLAENVACWIFAGYYGRLAACDPQDLEVSHWVLATITLTRLAPGCVGMLPLSFGILPAHIFARMARSLHFSVRLLNWGTCIFMTCSEMCVRVIPRMFLFIIFC